MDVKFLEILLPYITKFLELFRLDKGMIQTIVTIIGGLIAIMIIMYFLAKIFSKSNNGSNNNNKPIILNPNNSNSESMANNELLHKFEDYSNRIANQLNCSEQLLIDIKTKIYTHDKIAENNMDAIRNVIQKQSEEIDEQLCLFNENMQKLNDILKKLLSELIQEK